MEIRAAVKYLSSIALLCFVLTAAAPFTLTAQELTIVYTANSNGKLMYCSCPSDPYGGLSERVTLIDDLRKKEEEPFLLVDAGASVGLFGDYDLMASCVFRMMNLMQYDVAAAGRNEVFRGTPRILEAARTAKFPLVSASIVGVATKKPVFRQYIIKRVGKATVAVTSLSDSSSFQHVKPKEPDFTLLPPEEALGGIIGEMDAASDFIVVLSQMHPDTNRMLLEKFPAIDVIVEGYGNQTYDSPVVLPEGVIVSPGTYGEKVGLITMKKNGATSRAVRSRLIPVKDIPEDPRAHKIVVEYYRKRK